MMARWPVNMQDNQEVTVPLANIPYQSICAFYTS